MEGEIQFGTGVNPKMASVEAVVVRADGTRESLGVVAYYNKNPIKMLFWKAKQLVKGVL